MYPFKRKDNYKKISKDSVIAEELPDRRRKRTFFFAAQKAELDIKGLNC